MDHTKEPKRYSIASNGLPYFDDCGEYVRYDDFSFLRSALAEKTAQVGALKKERDAYKEQRYESNKDNARYLTKILKLREAAQGVLDDDDRSVSLKDQQSRWIYRMDKLREALAATAPSCVQEEDTLK